ncbi:MAG: hypothetical protein IT373_13670 [Polyangiaceae bacterium]|nr:hypothetical protein [Polyangiaceae bacterium]
MTRTIRTTALSLLSLAFTLAAGDAAAVGTRQHVLDSLKTFEGGDLTGVSVASNGTVQAGLTLGALPVPDATSVWAALPLADGALLLGTGSDGKAYRVQGGKATVAAETGAMAVSALTLGWNGEVVAGTFPEGTLFRFAPGGATGKLQPFVKLPGAEDVWAVAFDDKTKSLYAATGPEGKIFRVAESGKVDEYFDSDEPHIVSLALAPDGSLLAGSSGEALLYRLKGPARAEVVFDFEGDDVRAIAVAPNGTVYAVANSYTETYKGLRPRDSGGPGGVPQPTKGLKPGKGQLYRFDPSGAAERMMRDDETHYVALALDDQGMPYVGTGAEGRVYTVDDNHVVRLVADTEERQIGAIALGGAAGKGLVVGSDPCVVHAVTGVGGQDAVWTSKVLDGGMRAHFGRLEWRADGQLELQTRSGNTEKPDKTWSDWSPALAAPGDVKSPAARYVQVRARWAKDPKAVLREVALAFVTDNARALVTSLSVGERPRSSTGSSVPESGGPMDEGSSKVKINWDTDNPDADKLRFRIFYRLLDGKDWYAIVPADEILTKSEYSWDVAGLPEGKYRVRVDASDELSNPPDRVTRHTLESTTVVLDTTAPVLDKIALRSNRLSGVATDGASNIARIEMQLVGGSTWFPLFPTDGVLDEPSEAFDADVATLVPPAKPFVVVRAFDAAGNSVTRTIAAGTP